MKRFRPRHPFRSVLALLCLGLAAWVAAPAISGARYLPGAVDFEQSVPAGVERVQLSAGNAGKRSARDATETAYVTPPITAPKRFDLAGLAKETRPYDLRGRDEGGEWSEWVETGSGDPVYFGGADELQVRGRGFRPSGRVHYVNVSGTTSDGESALTSARTAINSAWISATTFVAPSAMAETAKPDIVSRREWGAEARRGGCKPRKRPDKGKVKAAVIHHTVSANNYSRSEAAGLVLGICRFHKNGNGWDDVGYNALVDRFGRIYEGREGGLARAVVGAHALGFNDGTTGVAALGTFSGGERVSKNLKSGIADFLAWKLDHEDIDPVGRTKLKSGGGDSGTNPHPKGKRVGVTTITKHRRLSNTDCPGDMLNREIEAIAKLTKRKIQRSRG
ncbi:hypothetical protein HJD18_00190 [Thermoleophilia bacterium SCSIO 60948]|nr:hypothetical protein HJD18_00190 [Thermoleophilia bacterium SCSIO 60948]